MELKAIPESIKSEVSRVLKDWNGTCKFTVNGGKLQLEMKKEYKISDDKSVFVERAIDIYDFLTISVSQNNVAVSTVVRPEKVGSFTEFELFCKQLRQIEEDLKIQIA
jgi:hypothetical protein